MFAHLLKLITIYILGYLFIKWFPEIAPIHFSEFIIELVLHPVEFFLGSISFIIGLIVHGSLVKVEISSLLKVWKEGIWQMPLWLFPLHIFILYSLAAIGEWQTLVFSLFAIIYGIISLDLHGRGGQHV